MSKLPSNARRAFLRPANQRPLNGLASSRIIGVALPVTIASTYSATAHFAPFCPAGLAGAPILDHAPYIFPGRRYHPRADTRGIVKAKIGRRALLRITVLPCMAFGARFDVLPGPHYREVREALFNCRNFILRRGRRPESKRQLLVGIFAHRQVVFPLKLQRHGRGGSGETAAPCARGRRDGGCGLRRPRSYYRTS